MKKIFGLSRLNMLALVLVACVAVIATAGGSIAYFSDNKQMTNTFTMGNVYISLSEAKMVDDGSGNRIPDPNGTRIEGTAIGAADGATNDYGSLYPGKQMQKDPTIKNTGSEPAYIAAKIIVKASNAASVYGNAFGLVGTGGGMFEGALFAETSPTATDGIRECASYTMRQSVEADGSLVLYVFVKDALKPTDAAITLFNTMCIDPEFDNAAMQKLSGLTVTVQAFAVQTYGFTDCFTAMTTAFKDHFKAFVTTEPQA